MCYQGCVGVRTLSYLRLLIAQEVCEAHLGCWCGARRLGSRSWRILARGQERTTRGMNQDLCNMRKQTALLYSKGKSREWMRDFRSQDLIMFCSTSISKLNFSWSMTCGLQEARSSMEVIWLLTLKLQLSSAVDEIKLAVKQSVATLRSSV